MKRYARAIAYGLMFVGLVGCGDKGAVKTDGGNTAEAAAPSAAAQTPDQAVMVVFTGLQEGRPQVVWEAMPASYQTDVNALVAEFSAKQDADLWKKGAGLLQKVVGILKTKKDFILAHPQVAGAMQGGIVDKEKVVPKWDTVVSVIETIVTSDLADPDKMKSFDGGKFLSTTGAGVMKEFPAISAMSPMDPYGGMANKLSNTKVTIVKSEGDKATVRLEAPGEQPSEEDFVKVEGKWIPEKVAETWKEELAKAKEKLAALPTSDLGPKKDEMLAKMSALDAELDKVAAAKTADEFNKALGGVITTAMQPGK